MAALATGMTTHDLFSEALESVEPVWELRGVVRGLLADGHDREALLSDLEAMRGELQASGRDKAEESVLDVMDFIVGWTSPHTKL